MQARFEVMPSILLLGNMVFLNTACWDNRKTKRGGIEITQLELYNFLKL